MNITKKIKNKYTFLKKNYLIRYYNGKFNFNTSEAIIISGVPRGGTTWLAELLSVEEKLALIWEPLHLEFYPPIKKLNFKWRQFIDINNHDHETIDLFSQLLTGKSLTRGILQKTSIDKLKNADALIVKFCRANRLLPWLTTHFEFKKVIHLLRHPCAVVSSQLSFGAWDDIEPFFTEEELKSDGFIENYYEIIKPINTIEEKLAAIWCLDNILPLTENKSNKWVSVTYENLLLNPEKSFERMDIEFNSDMENKFNQPSTTTKSSSPINKKETVMQQLSYWKTKLNEQQTNSILTILRQFNITIYNQEIYPTADY